MLSVEWVVVTKVVEWGAIHSFVATVRISRVITHDERDMGRQRVGRDPWIKMGTPAPLPNNPLFPRTTNR